MLSSARDAVFADPPLVARTMLASIDGTARAFYERDLPLTPGGDVEDQLTIMCRAYLLAASDPVSQTET